MTAPASPLIDPDVALQRLLAAASPISETETLPLSSALGRVLAQEVRSTIDVPPADNTAMDGYALRSAEVSAAGTCLPVSQRIPAGSVPQPLQPGTAARIFTGGLIPPGADAVVMQEQCVVEGDVVRINAQPKAGDWVRRRGLDVAAGSVVLAAGQRLRPQDLGLAASVGVASLRVRRKPRVAMLFTGDELAMPGEPLRPGAIYNSNRFVIRALLETAGCEVTDFGIVPDQLEATRAVLRQAALGHDLVVSTGGMSVGEEDHVKPAVQAEGALDLWQIAMKPGKPLAFGHLRRGEEQGEAAFIGLPGNPVSSFVTFLLFVRPFLLALQGAGQTAVQTLPVRAAFDWPKPDRRREYLRVRLNAQGEAELFASQNSAVLTSTVWADGLVDNPPQRPIARGDVLRYLPFSMLLQG
ncbi:MAG TPA: molybdopterin molybdotransferase MoeA [Thiomonas arsenitoxydans]|jgi:molybdopterin molybdotransferase|uniref:Molybdopterin molybdenumtransferase n=1 Tax=Thiomonas intermedia (strain K12) TaxID=75379 RepID=D5X3A2_THIK1|nr:gephyrin-like molybdotransferase Glp [Thiomonas sp.]HOI65470.1 molybdopterin molybdotransferase MoeA [Thiomonas arsenitoxydans]